jgi:hypothetical protein
MPRVTISNNTRVAGSALFNDVKLVITVGNASLVNLEVGRYNVVRNQSWMKSKQEETHGRGRLDCFFGVALPSGINRDDFRKRLRRFVDDRAGPPTNSRTPPEKGVDVGGGHKAFYTLQGNTIKVSRVT